MRTGLLLFAAFLSLGVCASNTQAGLIVANTFFDAKRNMTFLHWICIVCACRCHHEHICDCLTDQHWHYQWWHSWVDRRFLCHAYLHSAPFRFVSSMFLLTIMFMRGFTKYLSLCCQGSRKEFRGTASPWHNCGKALSFQSVQPSA